MRPDLSSTPMSLDMPSPQFTAARPQIYVITLEKGLGSDEYSMSIVSVTDNLVWGQEWVNKMNTLYRSLQKKRQLLALACSLWRQSHPLPPLAPTAMLDVPELPCGRPATIEEREERHRINNENFLRSLASRESHRQWSRQENAFAQAWMAEHLTPEEAELNATANENVWSIEPVPWHIA